MEERVCKFCLKRFPCGKSLGGHIRTHNMSENSLQSNEEKRMNANASVNAMFKFDEGRKRKRLDLGSSGNGDDGNLIYGLRENPKKTTRFVHSNAAATVQMEKFCKECGKGFPSLKALCGHMACHSEKDKGANRIESVSGVREKQKLVMDSQSDTEASVQTDSRRSRRMKFKNLSGGDNKSSSSLHWGNCSSSVSEVEQEQEDVARCLMLLSRDSTYKGRFPLVTESSDNNSVVVEEKSPSVDTKFAAMNHGKNIVGARNNGFELGEKKLNKDGKMKSVIGYVSDNSDSGYFTYGPKKVESDDSSDGFFRNDAKSSKVGYFSSFENHGFESSKIISRGRNRNSTEFKKVALDDSRKRQNIVENSIKKTKNGYNNDEVYETLKIDRESYSEDSAYESDENSSESDSYPAPKAQSNRNMNGKTNKKSSCKGKKKMKSKKSKEHECPICNKIFKSGQALGGHKRSHFIGGNDDNTLVIRPAGGAHAAPAPPAAAAAAANPSLFDLNLPAPDDE